MDFEAWFRELIARIQNRALENYAEALAPLARALQAFIDQLEFDGFPADWRERYAAFIAEQEVQYLLEAASVREVEAAIERWVADEEGIGAGPAKRDKPIGQSDSPRSAPRLPEGAALVSETVDARNLDSRGSDDSLNKTAAESGGTRQLRLYPSEPYDRARHYGVTPTNQDRQGLGAQPGEVVDHSPPLVQRYYHGDPSVGELPGFNMTPEQRAESARDRTRMRIHSDEESRVQGGAMSHYSRDQKRRFDFE